MMKKGFTLVEILVVIAAMGILGAIFSDFLVQVLRGQNKVRVITQVKQNGQAVLENLTSEIRQAEDIICIGHTMGVDGDSLNDTLVVFKAGRYTQFRLHRPMAGNNGKFTRDDFSEENIPNTVTDEQLCTRNVNLGNVRDLTDTNTKSGISVDIADGYPVFDKSLNEKPGFVDIINIRFKAVAGVGAGQTYEASVSEGGVLFTTAVQAKMSKK